ILFASSAAPTPRALRMVARLVCTRPTTSSTEQFQVSSTSSPTGQRACPEARRSGTRHCHRRAVCHSPCRPKEFVLLLTQDPVLPPKTRPGTRPALRQGHRL